MTKLNQIYKCNVCGNIVEVVHASAGTLSCCNQAMELQTKKTEDQGQEKHVPVVEKTGGGLRVKVGDVAHPMEDKHYIEWIEVIADDKKCLKFLEASQKPEADFAIDASTITLVRAYCNIHGLWKK